MIDLPFEIEVMEKPNRGQPPYSESRPNLLVDWLRCEICGALLPAVPWSRLPDRKHDLCQEHKGVRFPEDITPQVDRLLSLGKGYIGSTESPKPCKKKGILDCLCCPVRPSCNWDERTLRDETKNHKIKK